MVSSQAHLLIQPTSRTLLTRILDQPDLPARIQGLPPRALGALIDRIGLEDSGEIVALATTEQLAHVFDDDLWKNERPGEEERFDAGRFVVWLSLLLEAGDEHAARRLAELPEDLVTLALHRQVLVLDVDALAAEMEAAGEDAEDTDKALTSCLYEELDGYQIVSRDHEGWDTVLAAILALDRDHHAFLVRVLDRCVAMTTEYIESNGGLYEVLTSDEMLEGDVAGDREDRRAETGHVPPTDAAAFLKLAKAGGDVPPTEHDPLTRAYFRRLAKTSTPARRAPEPAARTDRAQFVSRKADALDALLREAADERGIGPSPGGATAGPDRRTPARLAAGPGHAAAEPLLVRAMRRLAEEAPALFAERTEELAYLVNVLVAGASFRGRRLRPVEATAAVLAACSEGLAIALRETGSPAADSAPSPEAATAALREHPADGLFRLAWRHIDTDRVLREACSGR